MTVLSQRCIISNLKRIGAVDIKKLKNVPNFLPRPGGKTSTPRIMKFTILVEAFLLYITMNLVFLTYM
jgi:hypothetical protein